MKKARPAEAILSAAVIRGNVGGDFCFPRYVCRVCALLCAYCCLLSRFTPIRMRNSLMGGVLGAKFLSTKWYRFYVCFPTAYLHGSSAPAGCT